MADYRGPFVRTSQGAIDCEINHPHYGWVPFTASPDDVEEHGRALYAILNARDDIVEPAP
jgi:hypothetical protein